MFGQVGVGERAVELKVGEIAKVRKHTRARMTRTHGPCDRIMLLIGSFDFSRMLECPITYMLHAPQLVRPRTNNKHQQAWNCQTKYADY